MKDRREIDALGAPGSRAMTRYHTVDPSGGLATTVRSWAVLLATITVVVGVAACHQTRPEVKRAVPGVYHNPLFAEASESELAAYVVCNDTLGRPFTRSGSPELSYGRVTEARRCSPCIPYGLEASAERSIAHARRMWLQGARAPYEGGDPGAGCTDLAYKYAQRLRPNDDSLSIEIGLFRLADIRDSVRALSLHRIDSLVQLRINEGRRSQAASTIAQLAIGMWDRAQRELERPADIPLHRFEQSAHQLAYGAPLMTQLPPVPQTSPQLGVSEAEWAARLFDKAAQMATNSADRSRWMRLSLAPWVVLERWASLDSAVRALLVLAPNDSALLPARALVAYRTMKHPVLSAPYAMAMFDSAVAHLPRADSMRFDSFDGVLNAEDDEWRYGFFPDQRLALETRGWSVLDPLWSTPVNEIRLARRARFAEADYRYADIALRGQSGSETRPGQVLMRRGAPTPRWDLSAAQDGRLWIARSWAGMTARAEIDDSNIPYAASETWRVFYSTSFSALHASTYVPRPACVDGVRAYASMYECAVGRRADWSDVVFYGRTDVVDVTVARFRATSDSADMYVGVRLPLRAFRARNDAGANRTDRIALGLWLAEESGKPIHHESVDRELPDANTLAYMHQWTHRVGPTRMMHRVEALEPLQPAGARGAARITTDAQVTFPVRGFGMSDLLIAASARPRQRVARRWNDLVLQPNGANVAPNARFAMVWEVYDLQPGQDGRVHWRVKIKRERGNTYVRSDMPSVLSGAAAAGTRVVASENDAPDMSYVREGEAGAPMLDNVVFGLGDAPVGYHVVNVTIDDLVSGKSVTRGVSVRVLAPESQKRGTPIGAPARSQALAAAH